MARGLAKPEPWIQQNVEDDSKSERHYVWKLGLRQQRRSKRSVKDLLGQLLRSPILLCGHTGVMKFRSMVQLVWDARRLYSSLSYEKQTKSRAGTNLLSLLKSFMQPVIGPFSSFLIDGQLVELRTPVSLLGYYHVV